MDSGGNVNPDDAYLVSQEVNLERNTSKRNLETIDSLPNVDLLTYMLPPTPEESPDLRLEQEIVLQKNIIAESSAFTNMQVDTSILYSPSELDVSLPEVDTIQIPSPCSQGADELTATLLGTLESQTEILILSQFFDDHQTVRFAEHSLHQDKRKFIEGQSQTRNDKVRAVNLEQTDKAAFVTKKKESSNVQKKGPSSKASNSLKFPPCVICCGKASGSHYGAITCESCKGFFRRYLQKKNLFKCKKGGNCEILSTKKGNCSGCRLEKCLALGMSKEKSKLGRYTLAKRTETIINMKRLEGTLANNNDTDVSVVLPTEIEMNLRSDNLVTDVVIRLNTRNNMANSGFNDKLVANLVQAMDDLEPYGPNIKTKEQILEAHKLNSERYLQKTAIFGKMPAIPKEEFNKLYKEFGIDVDGRIADLKIEFEDFEDDMARYCQFAKHIPGFSNLPVQDQSTLLKTSMMDFYTIIMIDCYSDEYRTFVSKNGNGNHYDELAGREFSEELLILLRDTLCRWQLLNLSKEETALLAALVLVTTDRCKLENRVLGEQIQLALTELLQHHIKKKKNIPAMRRFTKIIDSLTFMRDMSELLTKENNLLCQDEVIIQEFPFYADFIVEDVY